MKEGKLVRDKIPEIIIADGKMSDGTLWEVQTAR